MNTSVEKTDEDGNQMRNEEEDKVPDSGSGSSSSSIKGEEILSKRDEPNAVDKRTSKHGVKGRKSSPQEKNNKQEKQKDKDWTLELHQMFVQAMEQLGVDKAIPLRILELMGIDCLTQHNIANHLQVLPLLKLFLEKEN
ncbi:hypothetical protein V6N13_019028 [Hibiscus sabdariffa]|uniref:HTH myb-type domain-containing protein n=1 Tax=Hibiscus sabdariffa TaxID=183260 RepID=A0ABR2EK56_9ROSI